MILLLPEYLVLNTCVTEPHGYHALNPNSHTLAQEDWQVWTSCVSKRKSVLLNSLAGPHHISSVVL